MPSAYLLVAHGSRDPRPQMAMEQLAKLIYQHKLLDARTSKGNSHKSADNLLTITEPIVDAAYLELDPLPLHEQIKQKCDRALNYGCDRLQILPLFLLPGVHVMEDIPQEVAKARQISSPNIVMNLQAHLGTQAGLMELLSQQMTNTTAEAWILIAHGSRRTGALAPVEEIARELGVFSAYWAVKPSLETQIEKLANIGYQKIGIVPYFLFAGGITDAIAAKVNDLKIQFPAINFQLAEPLGASKELANLIINLIDE